MPPKTSGAHLTDFARRALLAGAGSVSTAALIAEVAVSARLRRGGNERRRIPVRGAINRFPPNGSLLARPMTDTLALLV